MRWALTLAVGREFSVCEIRWQLLTLGNENLWTNNDDRWQDITYPQIPPRHHKKRVNFPDGNLEEISLVWVLKRWFDLFVLDVKTSSTKARCDVCTYKITIWTNFSTDLWSGEWDEMEMLSNVRKRKRMRSMRTKKSWNLLPFYFWRKTRRDIRTYTFWYEALPRLFI